MGTFITIISAVLVFGFLIFIHEFGHYIFARIFKVSIQEFSIGMGPKIFTRTSKKTGIKYSIGILPIGGYVAMEGEDGESHDPNSFDKKPAWQRLIITVSGASVNIIFGFLAMILLTSINPIGGTTVAEFVPKAESGYEISTEQSGLMVGDEIISVDGKRVSMADELSYEIMRRGNKPVDVEVMRNGEKITLADVVFPTEEQQEQIFGMMDFKVYRSEKNLGTVLSYSWNKAALIVRMVWESLYDLITGRYTVAAISGPVGISSAIGDAAKAGFSSLLYITVLISINLGIMNLLPIPALDGARTLTILFEMITRKRIPPRIEGVINGVGLIVLLALSGLIMVKDIITLF